MQTTKNYNLNKPDINDAVDIAKLNENADKIDAELKNINGRVDDKAPIADPVFTGTPKIGTKKIATEDQIQTGVTIVNNLTEEVIGKALDATQGKALADQITSVSNTVSNLSATNIKLSANTTTFYGVPSSTSVDQILCMLRPTTMPNNTMFKVFSKDNVGTVIPNVSLDVYKNGTKVATIITDSNGQAIFVGSTGTYTFTDPISWYGFSSQSASGTSTANGDIITVPYIYTRSAGGGNITAYSSASYNFAPHITKVNVCCVGGGGGGAGAGYYGGGGGGGGLVTIAMQHTLSTQRNVWAYIGYGGSGGAPSDTFGNVGGSGSSSSFDGISAGGGTGGNIASPGVTGSETSAFGGAGGSGGGAGANGGHVGGAGGTNGGNGENTGYIDHWTYAGTGQGKTTYFSGYYYGGGGGGGGSANRRGGSGGSSGGASGGAGCTENGGYGSNGSAAPSGSGGGGGGGGASTTASRGGSGGAGGSGAVIISW